MRKAVARVLIVLAALTAIASLDVHFTIAITVEGKVRCIVTLGEKLGRRAIGTNPPGVGRR